MVHRVVSIAALLLAASPAAAHTGLHADGFAQGFAHPMGGWDHTLAMVAVGLWAGQLGGRARWLLPAIFVGAMLAGGVLGILGVSVPLVEAGIAASIVALGSALAGGVRLPLAASVTGVALFAVFHGLAHGAEIPAEASGFAFAAGFAAATMLLHAAGLVLAMLLRGTNVLRPLGGAIAITGAVLGLA